MPTFDYGDNHKKQTLNTENILEIGNVQSTGEMDGTYTYLITLREDNVYEHPFSSQKDAEKSRSELKNIMNNNNASFNEIFQKINAIENRLATLESKVR